MISAAEQSLEQAFNDTVFDSFDTGYYIGMMSGTSLDGLDAVICQFGDNFSNDEGIDSNINSDDAKMIATHSQDFPPLLRQVLLALCQPDATNQLTNLATDSLRDDLPQNELDWFGWACREYGEFTSSVVHQLLEKSGLDANAILALGCHGQTVRHRPEFGFTLQLIDPNIIAERTGISIVSDFRRRDMAVGGQGAPLAPAFHLAQFGHTDKQRIVVNLGGIANITVLPHNSSEQIIGYDTGPANTLLDAWYQYQVENSDLLTTNASFAPLYDKEGQWGKTGQVNLPLLKQLLAHPYFTMATPKSTGREDFNLKWLQQKIDLVQAQIQAEIKPEDIQATLTALTVQTLSDAIKLEAKTYNMLEGDLIICGGGAYNTYLLEQLTTVLADWTVLTSDDLGIAPTWIEAVAFAWLAKQTIMGKAGNVPAVTGANKAVVLGQVCFA